MDPDPRPGEPISKNEIKETLMKMSNGKAEGPDHAGGSVEMVG